MATFVPSAKDIKRDWFLMDAENVVIGRLATEAARRLAGKHKPTYTTFLDTGDHVIIVNAAKVAFTGRKVKTPKPTKGPQFPPGTVFLPDGFKSREEIQYLFRGAVACVRESLDIAAAEIRAKSEKLQPNPPERELLELARTAEERFRGAIEAAPPNRVIPTKRTFASLVERARARRREIGAFMRGLDLGKTEPSHLDTHSEASLQGLMEWGARLEMLADSREVDKPDFTQQHRVLDQLESTTEMLVVDVELTLRRYKDRMSARGLELSTLPV